MQFRRWLSLASEAALIGSILYGQELNIPEAGRVPVPKPTNVTLEKKNEHLRISWDVTPIKRVTAYEIFKKVDGGGPVRIATIGKPPFETRVPDVPTDFFVVAVDYRANRSKPSESVTYPPANDRK